MQQPGNIAIPKSANPDRIKENLDVFSFELTAEEMEQISALKRRDGRLVGSATGLPWDASPD